MTNKCENCIHYTVCSVHRATDEQRCDFQGCIYYKDKSLCAELPCATGIPLFFIYNRPYADTPDLKPKIYETNEWYFEVDEKEIAICPRMIHGYNGNYYYHLGKTVFLTKEQAQKVLKERCGE